MPALLGDPKSHPIDEFKDGLTGSCLCGSITVTLKDKELFTKPRGHLCHCANCRKVAGSYVSANIIIEKEKVDIVDRESSLKEFIDLQTGSGKPLSRQFCGICGKYVRPVVTAAIPLTSEHLTLLVFVVCRVLRDFRAMTIRGKLLTEFRPQSDPISDGTSPGSSHRQDGHVSTHPEARGRGVRSAPTRMAGPPSRGD